MSFIKWSKQYSVGIKEIDEQHQHLVDIINKMYEVVATEGNRKEAERTRDIEQIFEELFEYTRYHFLQLLRLKVRLIKGNTKVSLETLSFLNKWLVNHILGSDMKYASYLKERNIFNKIKNFIWGKHAFL